ncbi:MAG: hypothetical protein GXP46_01835 [Deferribacteres bacterium]|nr:hypothetical protein [Deferribacteres bacterium]
MIELYCSADPEKIGIITDGKLKPERLQAHIQSCDACRQMINFYAEAHEDLRYQDIYLAIIHVKQSITLMEQTKSAFKSKLIAQARDEAEKAINILEDII